MWIGELQIAIVNAKQNVTFVIPAKAEGAVSAGI
jgi:hypothetical protein